MTGERPSSPVHEVEPPRSGTETRVRPRSESEKTLPPQAPAPAKRRALLLMEGADDDERRSFDAVLTEADLEGALATLPKLGSHIRPIYERLGILPEVARGVREATRASQPPSG